MNQPTSESGVVASIVRTVRREYPGAWIMKVHGGPMQTAGIPDLLMCIDGLFIAAEVKHQKPAESEQHARERATPLQRAQIAKIIESGGMAGVVIDAAGTLDLIRWAKEKYEKEK